MLQDDGSEALETTDAAPTASVTEAAAATDPASPGPSRGGAPAVGATAEPASAAPAQVSAAVTEFDIGSPPSSPMEPDITDIADVTGPIGGGSPTEDFWAANAAAAVAQSSASVDASTSSASASKQQDDEDESEPGVQKMFQEAFPMDKLGNGVSAAKKMWSWGFSKVKESATKLSDDLANSDLSKQAERVSARMEAALEHGAGEVARLAQDGGDKFYTTVKKVQEELEPTLTQTQQRLSESATQVGNVLETHMQTAEEKASEIAEKMQLKEKAVEAKETAKSGLFSAMSGAAKTAIWFQSLGSTAHDSEDEEEGDFDSAPAAPGQAEASPSLNFMPPARNTTAVEAAPSGEVMARAANEPAATYTVPGPELAPMPTLDAAPLPATDISNSAVPEETASATTPAPADTPASAPVERTTVESSPAPAESTAAAEPAATPAPTPEVAAATTPTPAAASAPAPAATVPEKAPAPEVAPAPEPAAAATPAPVASPVADTKPAPAEAEETF